MANRKGRKPNPMALTVGNDPALWRYASLEDALSANVETLARLIRAGEEQTAAGVIASETAEVVSETV